MTSACALTGNLESPHKWGSPMQIVRRFNHIGGGAQIPRRVITHAIGEFVDDGTKIMWAPDLIEKLGLSVHYFITPTGTIVQQREDCLRAWHAKGNNENTIGIEWMVPGIHNWDNFLKTIKTEWVSEKQFNSGLELYKHLNKIHGIEAHQRHSDIDPQRKQDPGKGFPWEQLNHALGI